MIATGSSAILHALAFLLLILGSDALARYQTATGAVLDSNTGLLSLTLDQFANLKSLFFVIGGVTFEFTANAQIWPVRTLYPFFSTPRY